MKWGERKIKGEIKIFDSLHDLAAVDIKETKVLVESLKKEDFADRLKTHLDIIQTSEGEYEEIEQSIAATNEVKDKFNAKFPAGSGILISPHHDPRTGSTPHPIWNKNLYKTFLISGVSDLLPGDWVYFKNYADYITWNPGGLWTGEHALYMGGGKFQ